MTQSPSATRTKSARLITAMVTPFVADGTEAIDWDAVTRVTDTVLQGGTEALVLCGTTGEGSALTTEEKVSLVKHVKAHTAANQTPIIVASGTNNTRTTIELSKTLVAAGADALLVVCPYYVKPSQEGLFEHFQAVAKAVFPTQIIIYNIPGRCGVAMGATVMARLALECPNIIGVKQSHPDMDAVSEIRQLCPESFVVWSGDDSLTLPMMALGAQGVISVAAHVFGPELMAIIEAAEQSDYRAAQRHHHAIFPYLRALFTHPNPMDIKACLNHLGLISPVLRLPLVPVNTDEKSALGELFARLPRVSPAQLGSV